MTETITKKDPFDFLFFYEFDSGEREEDALLVGGDDPSTASPLHLAMGIKDAGKIVISPIPDVTTASSSNYHFKLQFTPGILLQPEQITVEEDDEWDLKVEGDTILYLLWKKEEEFTLDDSNSLELMLNGVMGTLAPAVRSTQTNVTLSWQFQWNSTTIIDVTAVTQRGAPGDGGDGGDTNPSYNNTITETLEMIQRQGKANIPLYVGFFSSNRVLNTDNKESNLKLRITNTSESPITFNYDSEATNRSQLIVALEVGSVESVPWALGTADQVNNVQVSIAGDKWQKTAGPENKGSTLEWTFSPKSADFQLASKETLQVVLSKIVTAHPTGTANLYLRYKYLPDYLDGEFICPIEKAPLVFPENNVGIGTTTPAESLHILGGNLRLDDLSGGGEIRTWGPLVFRSDVDKSSDAHVAKFFNQDQSDPLMVLDKDGNLGIGTKNPKTGDTGKGTLHVTGDYYGNGHMWLHSTSGDGLNGMAYVQARDDSEKSTIDLRLRTQLDGKITEVMHLDSSGNVGIGTTTPEAKLHVEGGDAKISGQANIGGAATIGGDATISGQANIRGNTTISGNLNFGNRNGQMLNLYQTGFGIGIQTNTVYFRTDSNSNFAWFKGGSHDNDRCDAGEGGRVQMKLDSSNNLTVFGGIFAHDWINIYNDKGLAFYNSARSVHWHILPEWSQPHDVDLDFFYQNTNVAWFEPHGVWGRASDERLKEDIEPVSNVLEQVMKLQPSSYYWCDSNTKSQKSFGFVAQNVETVFPQFVKEKSGFKGLNYDNFTVIAIAAIQDQQKLIASMQEEINNLKTQLQQ